MFFKSQALAPAVEEAVREALKEPQHDEAAARPKAAETAKEVASRAAGLAPQWAAFAVAAGVFVILLAAAIYLAGQADAQPAEMASSQLKDLSKNVQTLLVAWSAAVLGLIAGEAVGKKS